MARWDEILSLPVQSPPTLEFSAADLTWSKVEGWRDNIDRVALIPFTRVDDFVRGEASSKECPTRFHVEARRRRPLEAPYKVKVDGILEYILYWCSFGPDDSRKGGIVRPSRMTYVPKKKSCGRPNTKRGCTCHFIVKRLIAEPSVALIIYNQDKHVDKKGLPCHGPQDEKAAGTRAMYAPFISEDLRLRVYSLLYVGVSVETIMQRHNESVRKQGGPRNRDDLLTQRFVRIQERGIRRSKYELDADDDVSLTMWVESHPACVFFYEDFSENGPFTIGIQTEWQLQQMIRFGNRSLLASDSRFGTNKLKYPVHSLLVFDSENKAIPVAWVISPRFSSGDVYRWMRALCNRVRTKDPTWKLAGFIVDDPSLDLLAIRDVFECSVLISLWRVRHAWHKNLILRCSGDEMRVQLSQQLGEAVSEMCSGGGSVDKVESLMKGSVENKEFVEYFKAVWYPRMGSWVTALQTLPLSSQETCAAIEFYHQQLNLRLLTGNDPTALQRVDWLVDKLATKVHAYFWLDEYPAKHDYSRYWKDKSVDAVTSWRISLKIPDSDVILENKCAKVIDQQDRDKLHLVWNPGSYLSICDCAVSERGYLCEHVFKVNRVCRSKGSSKPSLSLFHYKQALIKMLHCPPHDSLIRDHAVTLASFVETHLNSLANLGGQENETERRAEFCLSLDQHRNEMLIIDQCVTSANDNYLEVNQQGSRLHQEASENVLSGESALREEMDIEPSSLCVSPSGLFALHGVLPADILAMNGEKTAVSKRQGMIGDDLCSYDDYGSQTGCEENSGQDCHGQFSLGSQSIDTPPSMESQDPCLVINQDDHGTDNSILDTTSLHSTSAELHQSKKRRITIVESKNSDENDGKISGRFGSDSEAGLRNKNGGSMDVENVSNIDQQCTRAAVASIVEGLEMANATG